jgi:hypothetical protein
MPWFPWLKKKETWEERNARLAKEAKEKEEKEAKEAAAKGLVRSEYQEHVSDHMGRYDIITRRNYVTPEVHAARVAQRKKEDEAKAKYNENARKRRDAETQARQDQELAKCRELIAKANAAAAQTKVPPTNPLYKKSLYKRGGERIITKRNRKSKRNGRTMKYRF